MSKTYKQMVEAVAAVKKSAADFAPILSEIQSFLRAGRASNVSADMIDAKTAIVDGRYWGTWVNPDDAHGEEDYDWQVLDKASNKKLDVFMKELKKKYKGVTVTCSAGEKNYVEFRVKAK